MPEYTDRIDVSAAPEAVFRFVADINNLPKYLPTPMAGSRPTPPPGR